MINTNPLVSVIVNCRNGQTFLDACIKSVLNQTYKNFELIFFDNLSTDMSNEIISKYKDNRIKKFSSAKCQCCHRFRPKIVKIMLVIFRPF